jgi:hypothetical protein
MKESQAYLNFLKRNTLFLLLPIVLSLAAGSYYLFHKPVLYQAAEFFELEYNQSNLTSKTIEADELVATLRSPSLQETLIPSNTHLTIFKPGPVAIQVEIQGSSQMAVLTSLEKVKGYLDSKNVLIDVGTTELKNIYPNYLLYFFAFLTTGLSIGLLLSLIREYFANY